MYTGNKTEAVDAKAWRLWTRGVQTQLRSREIQDKINVGKFDGQKGTKKYKSQDWMGQDCDDVIKRSKTLAIETK